MNIDKLLPKTNITKRILTKKLEVVCKPFELFILYTFNISLLYQCLFIIFKHKGKMASYAVKQIEKYSSS